MEGITVTVTKVVADHSYPICYSSEEERSEAFEDLLLQHLVRNTSQSSQQYGCLLLHAISDYCSIDLTIYMVVAAVIETSVFGHSIHLLILYHLCSLYLQVASYTLDSYLGFLQKHMTEMPQSQKVFHHSFEIYLKADLKSLQTQSHLCLYLGVYPDYYFFVIAQDL
jgi:hypothetical protein